LGDGARKGGRGGGRIEGVRKLFSQRTKDAASRDAERTVEGLKHQKKAAEYGLEGGKKDGGERRPGGEW